MRVVDVFIFHQKALEGMLQKVLLMKSDLFPNNSIYFYLRNCRNVLNVLKMLPMKLFYFLFDAPFLKSRIQRY